MKTEDRLAVAFVAFTYTAFIIGVIGAVQGGLESSFDYVLYLTAIPMVVYEMAKEIKRLLLKDTLLVQVSNLRTDVNDLKTTDLANIKTDIADTRTDIADVKTTDLAGLRRDMADMKTTDLAGLRRDMADMKTTDLAGLRQDLKRDINDLKTTDLAGLRQDMADMKTTDLAGLRRDMADMKTTDLAGLRQDMADMKTTDLAGLRQNLKQDIDDLVSDTRNDIMTVGNSVNDLFTFVRQTLVNNAPRTARDANATMDVMSRIVQQFIRAELLLAMKRGPAAFVMAANESDAVMHEAVRLKVPYLHYDGRDVSARAILLKMCTSEEETVMVESIHWL